MSGEELGLSGFGIHDLLPWMSAGRGIGCAMPAACGSALGGFQAEVEFTACFGLGGAGAGDAV